jgi:hypothetical protein
MGASSNSAGPARFLRHHATRRRLNAASIEHFRKPEAIPKKASEQFDFHDKLKMLDAPHNNIAQLAGSSGAAARVYRQGS